MRRKDIILPTPSVSEVERYLYSWQQMENYRLQEQALDQLFFELCPNNTDISEILLKVAALNDFYSTNIFDVFTVAKHILTLKIDDRLKSGDPLLVEDMRLITMKDGKTRNFYSFASKYCSHHNPNDFPIYDSYVDTILRVYGIQDQFADFVKDDLRNYDRYKKIMLSFRSFYGLEMYSLKQIDQYLWQLGKQMFPKTYYKR